MNEREKRDLIDSYLGRLDRALSDVPASARQELVDDVRRHIDEAWEASPDHSRTALLNILERLGEPEALAAEQRERLGLRGIAPRQGPDLLSGAAIVLTGLFWPVGILLAWVSNAWRVRDKLIATAVVLGGPVLLWSVVVSDVPQMRIQDDGFISAENIAELRRRGEQEGYRVIVCDAPQECSSQPSAAEQLADGVLWFFGLIGAALTAAMYLALCRLPHPHPRAVLLPTTAGVLVGSSLLLLLLQSSTAG